MHRPVSSDCVSSAGGRDSWWCWPGLRAPGVRSRVVVVLYASAVDGCRPPGAALPARWPWVLHGLGACGVSCCCAPWSSRNVRTGGGWRAAPSAGAATTFSGCVEAGPKGSKEGGCGRAIVQVLLGQLGVGMLCASQRWSSLAGRVALGSREGMQASCTGNAWVVTRATCV